MAVFIFMHYSLQQILVFLAVLPEVLSAIVGLVRFKKLQQPLPFLLLLVILALVTEIVSRVLWLQKIPNLFLQPVYISIEFGLIAWLYRHELKNMFIAKAIPILIPVFVCFTFAVWFAAGSSGFSPILRFTESLFILFFVLSFFYKTLKDLATVHLERMPMFWVSAGLFIYFAGDIIIFIFSNYMMSYSKQFNLQIWGIHAVFNMALYIFYTIALCINPKN